MQDRVATHPNRWKLTSVEGETDVYDFERADDPLIAGTPLDKATFLTDATAAAIAALTGNTPSLPTEAIDELAGVLSDMGVIDVAHIETGSYSGTGTVGSANPNTLTFTYNPRFLIIVADGAHYQTTAQNGLMWQYPNTAAQGSNVVSVSGNQISWYTTASATNRVAYQMNVSGTQYDYFAITVN